MAFYVCVNYPPRMRTKIWLTFAALIIALSTLAFTYQPQRTQWEYTETCKFADANRLGADGWELVAVTGSEAVHCFYYKRAK